MPSDPPAPFGPGATRRDKSTPVVRVGIALVLLEPGTGYIYVGKRKGSHGAGLYALPGGHLEMYESWEHCLCREVQEEMNITLVPHQLQLLHMTNDIMLEEEKHYITIFYMATLSITAENGGGIPQLMEPNKCEGWMTYSWDHLKSLIGTSSLFIPLENLLKSDPPAFYTYQQQVKSMPTISTSSSTTTSNIRLEATGASGDDVTTTSSTTAKMDAPADS